MQLEDILKSTKMLSSAEKAFMLSQKQSFQEGGVIPAEEIDMHIVSDMQIEITDMVGDIYKQLDEKIPAHKEGGAVKKDKEPEVVEEPGLPVFDIGLGDVTLKAEVAADEGSRKKGLSKRDIGEDTAMLFVFPKQSKHQMWMKDTSADLDVVYLDEGGVVLDVVPGKAGDEELLGESDKTKYVLEIPSGYAEKYDIAPGDGLDIPNEYMAATDDEDPSMVLLDEEGNPQMDLKGGERIFSREKTKVMVDTAVAAESEEELAGLGKLIADEVMAQDNRGPEYVTDQPENVAYAEDGTKLNKITRFPELGDIDITDLRNVVAKYGYTVESM